MKQTSKEFDELKNSINIIVTSMENDAIKFYNNQNQTAGIRLRKGYKEIRQLIQSALNDASPKNNK